MLLRPRSDITTQRLNPLALNFTRSDLRLDPRITFTGASARMLFDSTGTLQYATMNLLTYSEDFSNAAWTKFGASASGNTITADGTSAAHAVRGLFTGTGPSVTVQLWVEKVNQDFIQVLFEVDSAPWQNFDIETLTVGTGGTTQTSTIEDVGGGMVLLTVTATTTTATGIRVAFVTSNSATRYQTNTLSTSVVFHQAQVNLGTSAFDYIPTTTAAVYLPRSNAYQDHNPATLAPLGFLIEEQRTNLCLHSNDLTNTWTLAASTIGSNVQTAPDGTLTADSVITDTTSAFHGVNQTIAVVSGTTYTFSVFAKANGYNFLRAGFSSVRFGTAVAYFDLASGTVGTVAGGSATIKACNDGWYLCSFTATCTSTGTSTHSLIYASQSDNQGAYVGDGVSGIFAWGAQFEAGAFATSPILTTGAAATRLADVASITGTNFSSFYNQSEGTIVVSAAPNANTSQVRVLWSAETNVSERISPFADVTTNRLTAFVIRGVGQASQVTANAFSGTGKAAMAFKEDDIAGCLDGGIVTLDTLATLPTCNQLRIGDRSDGLRCINGHLQSLAYYAKRLPNATLQSLTV